MAEFNFAYLKSSNQLFSKSGLNIQVRTFSVFVIFSIEFDSLLVGLERKAEINENKAEFTHLQ